MDNPFMYGKEVSGKFFCDRETELKDIMQHVRSSTNLILFSQRRFGKTSLIKKVLHQAKAEGFGTVYADLGPVISEKTFVLAYSQAIASSLTGPVEKLLDFFKNLFLRLRPRITVDEVTRQPQIGVEVDHSDLLPYVEDVISSVQRYQKKLGKKMLVVFDEFQEVGRLENDRIEKLLRSHIQTHTNICYIFCGSKRHLIYEMFNDTNRPFYNSAAHYPLNKIAREHLAAFVQKGFRGTSRKISDDVTRYILDVCEDHPYYVQFLCNVIWDMSEIRQTLTSPDVYKAIDVLLSRESSSYTNRWDSLTIPQKKVLVALAKKQDADKLFSSDFLSRFELGYMSSTRASLQSLIKKDIIDKNGLEYSIIDVMFKKWIRSLYPYSL